MLEAENLQKFEITRMIYSNSEIFETECFLSYSWMFLRSDKLEQLYFEIKKIIGI